MREGENIAEYILRVDEVVNVVKGLGEEVDEKIIVQNVLRSLTLRMIGYFPYKIDNILTN
jgi:hypothetical protein